MDAAPRRDRTIGLVNDESPKFYGIKMTGDAMKLVHQAQQHSGLAEPAAIKLAVGETRSARSVDAHAAAESVNRAAEAAARIRQRAQTQKPARVSSEGWKALRDDGRR